MELKPSVPRHLWLDRFATRLGVLLCGVTPADAWRYAEDTFDDAADLPPKEAATIFAEELPPLDVGAPGD